MDEESFGMKWYISSLSLHSNINNIKEITSECHIFCTYLYWCSVSLLLTIYCNMRMLHIDIRQNNLNNHFHYENNTKKKMYHILRLDIFYLILENCFSSFLCKLKEYFFLHLKMFYDVILILEIRLLKMLQCKDNVDTNLRGDLLVGYNSKLIQ